MDCVRRTFVALQIMMTGLCRRTLGISKFKTFMSMNDALDQIQVEPMIWPHLAFLGSSTASHVHSSCLSRFSDSVRSRVEH
jgi:hypothetical protein